MWPPKPTIKYDDYLITFTEVPDEVSLCFNITGCPCACPGCFEPWLQQDRGDTLTYDVIAELLRKHNHVTCLCFMGGDSHYDEIAVLVMELHREFPQLKYAMYSGKDEMNPILSKLLQYYKIGPYNAVAGPLNKKTTNQIFYKKQDNQWTDITYRFQEERI